MIRFTHPYWLLLLLLIPPVVFIWRRYLHSPGVPRIMRSVAYLRGTALFLLILALAGTQWMVRNRSMDVLFLIDVSESITSQQHDQGLEFIRQASQKLGSKNQAGVIAFAREAFVDRPLGSDLRRLQRIEAAPERGDTNLQAGLELALSYGDRHRNLRVVVVSDGFSTRGDPQSLLGAFRERGVPVDAYLLGSMPEAEVSIEQVVAPSRVEENQPFAVRVIVAATQETTGNLWLFRNGQPVAEKAVHLAEGTNIFDFTGFKERSGINTFEARIEASHDSFHQNNSGYATVTVEGPSKVLVITRDAAASGALISALRRNGILTEVADPAVLRADATTLSAYSALLIHDVPAVQFSSTQLEQIASYVRELGGGLLTVGGHNSYGLGGYHKTPLEDVLPVAMDVSQTLVMPSLAMVLVLDKSGSMAGKLGKFDKITLAKEAALGVLDVLNDHDLIGVLAFDSEPIWIVPLQQVADRMRLAHDIGTISAGGGTDLGPAMLEAYNALSPVEALVKHAIILSDGQSMEYDFPSVTALLRRTGTTVSTVAIGEDADRHLLAQIARWGSGRFYYTDDAYTIPQIFATEAFMVSRPLAVEERFRPKLEQPAPFLANIDASNLPPLTGYVLTSPKATAALHLVSDDGSPILASWRRGLGRVISFTSGATTTWAAEWLPWSSFGSFWSQTIRWVMRPERPSQLRTHFEIHEGQATLVVDAIDAQGQFINFLDLRSEVLSPQGRTHSLRLEQTAPGQYRVQFPAGDEGAWLAAIADPNHASLAKPFVVSTVLPYSSEYRLSGQDSGALERLVRATGGTLVSSDEPSASELGFLTHHPSPVRSPRSLQAFLVLLAFIIFLLDIVLRYLPPVALQKVEVTLFGSASVVTPLSETTHEPDQQKEQGPEEKPPFMPALRLEDVVLHRRQTDLTGHTRSEPRRYLARRRARQSDKTETESR